MKSSHAAEEERLLVEAAQRNPAAFRELYEAHFERVYAYIARRVGNREEVEDLTADVFHRALANLPRFEWRGAPFVSWLFKIAAHAIADRARRNSKELELTDLDPPGDDDLNQIQDRARIFQLVNSLPADQRRVVVLRFAEGKSIREIAGELHRTEGAVKQLQFRALQNLRARCEQKQEGGRR